MFPDRIGVEETIYNGNIIENLGGLIEKYEAERVKLPMFSPVRVNCYSFGCQSPPPVRSRL